MSRAARPKGHGEGRARARGVRGAASDGSSFVDGSLAMVMGTELMRGGLVTSERVSSSVLSVGLLPASSSSCRGDTSWLSSVDSSKSLRRLVILAHLHRFELALTARRRLCSRVHFLLVHLHFSKPNFNLYLFKKLQV